MSEYEQGYDPSDGQMKEEIAAYYKAAEIGDAACIWETSAGFLRFVITQITARGVRTVSLKHRPQNGGGAAFYYDGRNWKYSRGQSRLVIPTQEIEGWVNKNPMGARAAGSMLRKF